MMECSRRDCRKKTSVLVAGYCPHCAARCIADLREEVCRLQDANNELVREQWRQSPGQRTVETLTE